MKKEAAPGPGFQRTTSFFTLDDAETAKGAGRGLVAALLLFVGIPLPGTGAWTGTLAASILDMKFKDVLIACMGGVLLAGIIMGLASAGLLGALSGLFAV